MRIMTFNTQHCLSFVEQRIDFQLMADTITGLKAEIVGLNEIRGKGTDPEYTAQTEKLALLAGFPYYYFAKAIDVGGSNPYGNALLSKIPIESVRTILIPEPLEKVAGRHYERRCILKAKLEGGITVLVTHFGLSPEEQIQAVKAVEENLEDEKCILMGDFNVTPDNKVLDPIRKRMMDTAELFEKPLLSFCSDKPTVKIDYIFVSPDIIAESADIPAIVASDHRPHIAQIKV